MKKPLSATDRGRFAEKIMEVGNLVLAALVVGQVLSNKIDLLSAGFGVIAFIAAYYIAYQIVKRR